MSRKRKKAKYRSRMSGVYLSAIIAVWSGILAFLLLQNIPLISYYALSTALITAAVLILKIHFVTRPGLMGTLETPEQDSLQTEGKRVSWKVLMLVFCMLLAALFVPLVLAWIVPSDAWFVLIISLTSGVSIAEVLFYLYLR